MKHGGNSWAALINHLYADQSRLLWRRHRGDGAVRLPVHRVWGSGHADRPGSVVHRSGHGDCRTTRRRTGKVAIFSSAFMGTISGSSIANTVTTGALTIPAMKRVGYPPRPAGAVEATSSTGGQGHPADPGCGRLHHGGVSGNPARGRSRGGPGAGCPALLRHLHHGASRQEAGPARFEVR